MDAVVVGAGPNGLAAAIAIARAGLRVRVLEANAAIGGGTRSEELTLPGFVHDTCSAIHPLGAGSPFFSTLPLAEHGLEWIDPPAALAHPFDDGTAVLVTRSVDDTAEQLGADARAYRRLIGGIVRDAGVIFPYLTGPFRFPRPADALPMARFGLAALRSASGLARATFAGTRARTLFAGLGAHSQLRLEQAATAGFALSLGVSAHVYGWPLPRGGSQRIADALASYLRSLGGEIVTGARVTDVDELPQARAVLFDLTPRQLVRIAGRRFTPLYRRQLERYRYGPGVFKLDWALDGPVPWRAAECATAGTVHLGGSLEEIAESERAMATGRHAERPFVLVAQQSLFDASRAPAGKHTLWAYCHVPNGSTFDMTERIEAQVERFAPGFRDRIIARSVMPPAEMERHNENYIGGEINGGAQDLRQFWTRPAIRVSPYTTSDPRIFVCSSSTPPGGGVHGMCGYHAARAALAGPLRR